MRAGLTPNAVQWCRCGGLRGPNLAECVAVRRRFRAKVGVFWQSLSTILSIILHRSPLPEPDGLIDEKGVPVPQSQKEASDRVAAANRSANEIVEKLLPGMSAVTIQENFIEQNREAASSESEVAAKANLTQTPKL